MDDIALRRKLLRSSLLELALSLGLAIFLTLHLGSLLLEAFARGTVTLYVGGQIGLAAPVKLVFARSPLSTTGVLLFLAALTFFVGGIALSAGYQAMRRVVPSLALPLRSARLARLAKPLVLLSLFLGCTGSLLVAVQYVLPLI